LSLLTAIKTGDVTELPGRRDEDWRWTDLRGLVRDMPRLSEGFDGALDPGPFAGLGDASHVLVNGGELDLTIGAGQSQTVSLRLISRGDGRHATRVSIKLKAEAQLVLLETQESDGASLAQISLTLDLATGAKLERVLLVEDHPMAITVNQADVTLSSGADYGQTVLTSGARRQRLETHVQHPGGEAQLRLDGAYLLAGKAHSDQTTVVTHPGLDGATRQLTKGVARDQARAVFQGRIVVTEGADRTDARMAHHALLLSDQAEVDSKPELEIYADDVACAHGNTVGAMDEDALFYACQRGIPEPVARAMLAEAFIGEVLDRIGHDGARDVATVWAAERLAVRS